MDRIIYNLFGIINIVNCSGYRLSKSVKARIRSFAVGPRVFVNSIGTKPGEVEVLGDDGKYLYNVCL